jgi:hypothetical protein
MVKLKISEEPTSIMQRETSNENKYGTKPAG